jgi:hypothetical protein
MLYPSSSPKYRTQIPGSGPSPKADGSLTTAEGAARGYKMEGRGWLKIHVHVQTSLHASLNFTRLQAKTQPLPTPPWATEGAFLSRPRCRQPPASSCLCNPKNHNIVTSFLPFCLPICPVPIPMFPSQQQEHMAHAIPVIKGGGQAPAFGHQQPPAISAPLGLHIKAIFHFNQPLPRGAFVFPPPLPA